MRWNNICKARERTPLIYSLFYKYSRFLDILHRNSCECLYHFEVDIKIEFFMSEDIFRRFDYNADDKKQTAKSLWSLSGKKPVPLTWRSKLPSQETFGATIGDRFQSQRFVHTSIWTNILSSSLMFSHSRVFAPLGSASSSSSSSLG